MLDIIEVGPPTRALITSTTTDKQTITFFTFIYYSSNKKRCNTDTIIWLHKIRQYITHLKSVHTELCFNLIEPSLVGFRIFGLSGLVEVHNKLTPAHDLSKDTAIYKISGVDC